MSAESKTMAELNAIVLAHIRTFVGCEDVTELSLYRLLDPIDGRNWSVANIDNTRSYLGNLEAAVKRAYAELGKRYRLVEES